VSFIREKLKAEISLWKKASPARIFDFRAGDFVILSGIITCSF
jgi:hypothetical protein